MTQINFVVGLTDVVDYDGFTYDEYVSDNIDFTSINYNIRKASTEIEKERVVWSLDMSLDATKNMIKTWEHAIKRPHLNMIGINIRNSAVISSYKDYDISIGFINLIPLVPEYLSLITDSDYNKINHLEDQYDSFGDLFLNINSLNVSTNIDYQSTLEYAYREDNVKFLEEHAYPYVMPRFNFDFTLRQRRTNNKASKNRHSNDFLEWFEKNKDVLDKHGYTLDKPYCNVGGLRIGSLIGDPWDEYQKLHKYNRICRTSMVLVEE